MNHNSTCVVCEGTGHGWCKACGGSGFENFNPWEASSRVRSHCRRCQGSGRDPDPDPACQGTGVKLGGVLHEPPAPR